MLRFYEYYALNFDALIDEAIDKLGSESVSEGVEALEGIAETFAKAGFEQKQFLEMREYIIREAKKKAGSNGIPLFFIEDKIKQAEGKLHERRTGKEPGRIIIQ